MISTRAGNLAPARAETVPTGREEMMREENQPPAIVAPTFPSS